MMLTFALEHPFITFFIALAALRTVQVLIRGYGGNE